MNKVSRRDLLDNTTILTYDKEMRKFVILEALVIKEKRPSLNSQTEGLIVFWTSSYINAKPQVRFHASL